MSSICSFSDGSPHLLESAESTSELDVPNSMGFIRCENCKGALRLKRHSSVGLINKNNGRVCQRCYSSLNNSSTTIETPDSASTNAIIDADAKSDAVFKSVLQEEETPKSAKVTSSNKLNEDVKDKSSVRNATFFDVAVMRCLLCPKWHHEGYLWALEYLSYRTTEITDYTLKEQDRFFKFKSASMPFNLDEVCVQMGIGASDTADNFLKSVFNNKKAGYNNQFIDLINQIYIESDLTNPKYNNLYDYSKRKKYEANFHTRIR